MVTLCLSDGVADDHRRRRARPHPARQQQRLLQDNEISWVDWRPDDAWLDVYEVTKTALRLRREHPALRQRHWFEGTPTILGGPKDLAWLHPSGREMAAARLARRRRCTCVGMFVSGDPLRSPGPHGEQQVDSSFVIWFNAGADAVEVTLPENDWVQAGEVVLSTDPDLPVGTPVHAGDVLTLGARTVVVLREA